MVKLLMDMDYDVRCAHVEVSHPAQNAHEWVESGDKIVIPWRDPDLSRISSRNRHEEPRPWSEFMQVLKWGELPNVHIFEVEPGDETAKEVELAKLQAFLGAEDEPETDWAPVNVSEDVTGLKAAYIDTRPVVPIESLAPDPVAA